MNKATPALAWALVMTQACAAVRPQPLRLPPRTAPLEHRVAAYRAHAAMPHIALTVGGWAMRMGDEDVSSIDEVRPFLANSPAAEEQLHERDNQNAISWALLGTSLAMLLGSLVTIPFAIDRDGPVGGITLPLTLIGVSTALSVPAAFVAAAAQRRVPPAAEAYNRWLWNELDLPRAAPDGRLLGPTPHPAPASPTPWSQ